MHHVRTKLVGGIVAVATIVLLGSTGAAYADSSNVGDANAQSAALTAKAQAADQAGYIIVGPSDAQQVDGQTFYPTGPISSGTKVIVRNSDGSLPAGVTAATLQAITARQPINLTTSAGAKTATVSPMITEYSWSATSGGYSNAYTGDNIWGYDSTAKASYYFYTAAGYNERASGQGLGYYKGYNGSVFGTWAKYYYVGNAGSSGAGASVPWGEVVATEKFEAICTQTVTCFGNWKQ